MKNIGLVVNKTKDTNLRYTKKLIDIIKNNGMNAYVLKDGTKAQMLDLIVSIGGDGTLLKTSKIGSKYNKPVVGVNLGKLGFLTQIDKDNMEYFVKRIIANDYSVQKRMMLKINIVRNGKIIVSQNALNDVVISRKSISRVIRIDSYIDDVLQNQYLADGLIVATPSGSTAYSLSAGGPIVDALANVIVITPVCPHSFCDRSFVTTHDKTIKIKLDLDKNQRAIVTIDGQEYFNILKDDIIIVEKSDLETTLVTFDDVNCFEILGNKLGR